MNRAKIIIPVSRSLEEAIKFYGITNNFRIVPNVVNTEMFHPTLNRNKGGKKRILLVALLSPQKGISYLLHALAQLKQKRKDFVLDIVGDGPNRREYEEITRRLGLGDIVKFYGLKTKIDVAEFMKKCSFFIQPSLWETFNVVCIEAMACGLPIVATRLSAFQEKITEENGILIPPKDIDALTKAIDNMLDNYQNYSPEKISQYAKKNFSYEVVGKRLDNIYREIL
jgi:glycosyltransferase involved in cell wall biosynthesis